MTRNRRMPWWPLLPIAAPAAVAIWSGWVGLGTLCGFGIVHPLPGIVSGFQLNTAITLPIGVEAYGAYALGAWLMPGTGERARAFAMRSALGALALGCTGQVTYHLLAAAHARRAPWPIVIVVSCLPIVSLAFGTALVHLLRADENEPEAETQEPELPPVLATVPADVLSAAKASYAATVAAGNPLSQNQLIDRFGLTRAQATKVRQSVAVESNGHLAPGPEAQPQ
jgi:hypothetical protein